MKGILILCNKCRKKMDGVCKCGNYKCLVQVYWKGKYYEFRRDDQGYVFTYDKAIDRAVQVSSAIKKGEFRTDDFKDSNVRERKFEYQIDRWLQEKISRETMNELSPGTTSNYAGYVKNYYHLFNGLDVNEVREINRRMIEFKETLDKVKIKTRRNIINALHNFFRWLMDEKEIIDKMPKFPKITGNDSKPSRAIDCEIQDESIGKIPVKDCAEAIEFFCETGIRPGEGCALQCGDINLKDKTVTVERGYKKGNKIKPTTKGRINLTVPLSERALEIVRKNMKDKLPKQFLFINPNTTRGYLPKAVWYQWHKYSGIENITLCEAGRHSFGSQIIQKYDVTFVKELLGHSDIRTTQKYLHLKMTKLSEIVNSRRTIIKMENRSEIEVKNEG
jgi:integrase